MLPPLLDRSYIYLVATIVIATRQQGFAHGCFLRVFVLR
jgi:hypothetical protein